MVYSTVKKFYRTQTKKRGGRKRLPACMKPHGSISPKQQTRLNLEKDLVRLLHKYDNACETIDIDKETYEDRLYMAQIADEYQQVRDEYTRLGYDADEFERQIFERQI